MHIAKCRKVVAVVCAEGGGWTLCGKIVTILCLGRLPDLKIWESYPRTSHISILSGTFKSYSSYIVRDDEIFHWSFEYPKVQFPVLGVL